jgi:predicted O-methyltransferase YrrM
MTNAIPLLTLQQVLAEHLAAPMFDGESANAAVAAVDHTRAREMRLRRWIPPRLLRRFDRGFARSFTIQPETARALYAVARAVRPDIIVETGTYWGYSTAVLAAAARDANVGIVHSYDLYPRAGAHIPDSLRPWIRLHLGAPATETMPALLADLSPQLVFQDSVHDYHGVLAELRVLEPKLAARAVVLFHDFLVDGVRQAAIDALPGYFIARIDVDDPQQLGIAIAPRPAQPGLS